MAGLPGDTTPCPPGPGLSRVVNPVAAVTRGELLGHLRWPYGGRPRLNGSVLVPGANRSCFWHLCAGDLGLAIGRLTELTRQGTSRDGSQYPLLISGALPQLAGARPDGRGYAVRSRAASAGPG
jgi:hypothetical protein